MYSIYKQNLICFCKKGEIIMQLTLEKAKEILPRYTTEDHLFTHAQAVSACMEAMADYFHEDRDQPSVIFTM